ncbi:MAG: hypothetical protein N5P05_003839 [Chroococcopsis gigantea SAG 12.99]|nr:hypothetical protein [Chlorogloea purpurea SAG 13.99]MDV3002233.1 hypothetical protein [Chroococcopsis gigantea SAG 12.99]
MLSTRTNNTFIRNYIVAAVSVMAMSMGVADLVNNPARLAQQDRLDGYGRYVGAGLVNYAQTLDR